MRLTAGPAHHPLHHRRGGQGPGRRAQRAGAAPGRARAPSCRPWPPGSGSGGVTKVLPPCPREVCQDVGQAPARRRAAARAIRWSRTGRPHAVAATSAPSGPPSSRRSLSTVPVVVLGWPLVAPGLRRRARPRRAWGRAPRRRSTATSATCSPTDHLTAGSGALERRRTVLERDGVIGWVIGQSYFQRRRWAGDARRDHDRRRQRAGRRARRPAAPGGRLAGRRHPRRRHAVPGLDVRSSGPTRLAGVRIATWNVNSLRSRIDRVEAFLERHDVDVLAVQETKAREDQLPLMGLQSLGYDVAAAGFNQWNGVALISRVGHRGRAGRLRRRCRASATRSASEARAIGAICGGVRDLVALRPQRPQGRRPALRLQAGWLAALRDAAQGWLGERHRPRRRLEHRPAGRGRLRHGRLRQGHPRHPARAGGVPGASSTTGTSTWCGRTPPGRRSTPTGTTTGSGSSATAACASTSCSARRRWPPG